VSKQVNKQTMTWIDKFAPRLHSIKSFPPPFVKKLYFFRKSLRVILTQLHKTNRERYRPVFLNLFHMATNFSQTKLCRNIASVPKENLTSVLVINRPKKRHFSQKSLINIWEYTLKNLAATPWFRSTAIYNVIAALLYI
jgi:hypothetical protein